ncbi:anterior gradient protein 3-like [Grus japonensis]|uniref:Anterior gradient protein 3-like n=1 Tax=Grus japonensis TaxID=30415 RepID=A0ABC9X326_GRUJA
MHAFPLLCSLLLCNGVTVAAQKKIQKLPDEGEESPAQVQTPQTLSRALREAFASSQEIQQMAQEDFIMLNLVHSSSDDNMAPDGHYVPRILFVDPSMTVRADLTGKYENRMYAYEPEDISTCE